MQFELETEKPITMHDVIQAGAFIDTDGDLNFVTEERQRAFFSKTLGKFKVFEDLFEDRDLRKVRRLLDPGTKITITV